MMMRPLLAVTALSTDFSRSSNSPRNLAPAIIEPRSSAKMILSLSSSGTSRATIRCASPSTTAVLPTPASPMSTGLFLVRRMRICMTRRISSSRPMTGSSLPCRACSVRSRPYFLSASYLSSGSWSVTRSVPRTFTSALRIPCLVTPACFSNGPHERLFSASAISRCSTLMYSSLSAVISSSALRMTTFRSSEMTSWPTGTLPETLGSRSISCSTCDASAGAATLRYGKREAARPSF